jgi:hypothetical protein
VYSPQVVKFINLIGALPSGKALVSKTSFPGSSILSAPDFAHVAQMVEHYLGKVGVAGSIPVVG